MALNKFTTAISKGDVLAVERTSATPDAWRTATTGDVKPFAIAGEAAAATDITVSVGLAGWWWLQANGAIDPNQFVMPDTNGNVKAWDGANENTRVGLYLGHPGELGSHTVTATAAIAGDIILVDINRR